MLKNFRINHDEKGFTLIELMIVIAIIGILSAIAIPNFISYRNKSFCSAVETDVKSIAAGVADYFADPDHTQTPTFAQLTGVSLSNSSANASLGGDPNASITISVDDGSGRCPRGGTFTLIMGDASGSWN